MNTLQHTTELALHVCSAYIEKEDIAIDCTCGNGHDTLWLAKRCKEVYSFDIQKSALESAEALMAENMINNVRFIEDSHERIKDYVCCNPKIIVFNLGFLPGGDKSITTNRESSLNAIKDALDILAVDGILSITMYPGHEEGALEQEIILDWARQLNAKEYHAVFANMLNQSNRAPQVLWITKKK